MNFKEEIKMRIQHNIAALNSYRQLSGNNSAVAKNLEKLSSGYRINRAGDDAAGLAISEKMRAQITGLETAQKNANDGISLVQTAEGALTEVHSMLNRMVELATQSANGTYDNNVDRENLQKELDSLLDEVDRISEATNFNGINLLDGSLGGAKVTTTVGSADGAKADATPTITGNITSVTGAEGTGAGGNPGQIEIDFTGLEIAKPADTAATGAKATVTIGDLELEIDVTADMDAAAIADAVKTAITNKGAAAKINNIAVTADVANNKLTIKATGADANKTDTNFDDVDIDGFGIEAKAGTPSVAVSPSKAELNFSGRSGKDLLGSTVTIGNSKYAFVEQGATPPTGFTAVEITKDSTSDELAAKLLAAANAAGAPDANFNATATKGNTASVTFAEKTPSGKDITVTTAGAGLTLQVGDTDDDFQKVRVAVGDMSMKGLGLAALKNAGIKDQITAGKSIDKIKSAINTVSSTRGDLGAIQNRLEHTINNLGVTTENMTAAESRIRDTDMAKEMMAYTKNNILVQAAQAMLAQANQVPQGVLQLLQ